MTDYIKVLLENKFIFFAKNVIISLKFFLNIQGVKLYRKSLNSDSFRTCTVQFSIV